MNIRFTANIFQKNNFKNKNLISKNTFNFKGSLDKDVIEIQGTQTKAKVYTGNLDYKTYEQIKTICSHPVFKDVPIRIMPDVHPSKNTVVGFSAPVSGVGVIPGIIGGDIGCGMLCVQFDTQGQEIDFEKLDNIVRNYVSCKRTKTPSMFKKLPKSFSKELQEVCRDLKTTSSDFQQSRLGTIGQGNHFVEIDRDKSGKNYLIVHTGSRNLGKQIAQRHGYIAGQQNRYWEKGLSYLTGDEANKYMSDMKIAQKYAQYNRKIIADEILYRMGWKEKDSFECVHNYIDDKGMIRKGSISAKNGEQLLIPLNMRDGVILAKGKGNPDWNNTAPHGAGRKITRSEAQQSIEYDDFVKSMKGIYTTSVKPETIDEAPMAYKNSDEIIHNISETAEVEEVIKPIYNYKDN